MSSHHVSVSGSRALSTTVNDPARTSAQMPSKQGDLANVTIQSFREIDLVLPAKGVTVERFKDEDGSVVQVLKVKIPEGYNENALVGLTVEALPGKTGYPHTSVSVRKEPDGHNPFDFYTKNRELAETIDLEIPPTEPDE